MRTPLPFPVPRAFHFEHTVLSHGWCALSPFSYEQNTRVLTRTLALPDGRGSTITCRPGPGSSVLVEVEHTGRLRQADLAFLTTRLVTMLHLDLDLAPFHRRMKTHPEFAWMAKARAGRMLRGATFFEDVIKMILTTNCSWSFTERMNERLVAAFGSGTGAARDFPTPEALADSSEARLRNDIKLGYRAPYVLALSRRVASGSVDIEAFRSATAPAAELFKELRALEGVGPYAAGNLLKLLGRFDYLGLDSWCRAAFSRMYSNGGPVSDADIERFYAPYEEWKGLVMWLDVTRQWYADKFPFLATGA